MKITSQRRPFRFVALVLVAKLGIIALGACNQQDTEQKKYEGIACDEKSCGQSCEGHNCGQNGCESYTDCNCDCTIPAQENQDFQSCICQKGSKKHTDCQCFTQNRVQFAHVSCAFCGSLEAEDDCGQTDCQFDRFTNCSGCTVPPQSVSGTDCTCDKTFQSCDCN